MPRSLAQAGQGAQGLVSDTCKCHGNGVFSNAGSSAGLGSALGLAGVQLHILEPSDSKRVWDEFRAVLAVSECAEGRSKYVLDLRGPETDFATGRVIFGLRGIQVSKLEKQLVFVCGDSRIRVGESAQGHLGADFRSFPLATRRDFLVSVVVSALRRLGRWGLHANGVTHESGTGVLIVGPSGSGKTTLTLALARAGWSFVGDDSVLLEGDAGKVTAHPIRRFFSVTDYTLRRFPELSGACIEQDPFDHKWSVDVASIEGFTSKHIAPRCLLFPSINPDASPNLIRLSKTEAMAGLIAQSGIPLFKDPVASAQQLSVLRDLTTQTVAFRVQLNEEVLLQPSSLERLSHEIRSEALL